MAGDNNDLAEDCLALVAVQNHWAAVSSNNVLPATHPLRTWGVGSNLQKNIESWTGVSIELKRIRRLVLDSSRALDGRIQGTIPDTLSRLTQLLVLSLDNNRLSGNIPSQLGNLTRLSYLSIASNQILSGSIPSQIGSLTELTELHLDQNALTGSIPTQIGNLTKLTNLDLSINNLSGSIPSQIGSLTELTELHLDQNAITGSIPTQIGSLSKLQFLFLSSNQISGSIPTELGNLTQLQTLHLRRNRLSGSIPTEIGTLKAPGGALTLLAICSNYITGSMPMPLRSGIDLGNYPIASGFDPVRCQAASNIVFSAPTGFFINPSSSKTFDAAAYASDGEYTISCDNAASLDPRISIQRTGCSYRITAGETRGVVTLIVPYTSSGGTSSGGTRRNGTVTVNIAEITFTPPTGLNVGVGTTAVINARSYASDPGFTLSCGDAKSVGSKIASIQRTGCSYTVRGGNLQGAASFTVPYKSSSGDTAEGVISLTVGFPSSIVFSAPTDLSVAAGSSITVDASSYATDGAYTITCGDATGVDSKITIVRTNCSYAVTAGTSTGIATFTVPYTSSGGDTRNGVISIAITTAITSLSATGCTDGTFVDLTANPRVSGANNDLVEDCQALVAMQNHWAALASNHDLPLNHKLRTWGTGTATQKRISSWAGVTVTSKRINDLNLRTSAGIAQLEGSMPTQLGNLTRLFTLDLANNQLSGSIPTQLGSLTNLQRLDLSGNQLTGTIPTQLGSLTALRTLRLNNNQLSGSIPTQLGSLTGLLTLRLDNNQLSGSIPTQLGSLSSLTFLELDNNQLSGSIPTQLGSLTTLQTLNLQGNQLTGSIPAELSSLTRLRTLDLADNQIRRVIPPQLGNLLHPTGKLTSLSICNNYLGGAVPAKLRSPSILTNYPTSLGYDPISCQIGLSTNIVFSAPSDLSVAAGSSITVNALSYATDGSHTITCGDATGVDSKITIVRTSCSYAVTAGANPGVATFTVPYTSSGGDTQNGIISIAITAEITSLSATGCTDGTFVDLTANPRVPGANNDLVEDCQALVAIQNHWAALASNHDLPLNHALRAWGTGTATQKKISNWAGVRVTSKRVRELDLRTSAGAAKLEGTIPTQLGSLTDLRTLNLRSNRLTGTIPTQLGNLINLQTLNLQSNRLTGSIPTQTGSLTNLRELDLAGNQLTGNIPTQLGSLTSLRQLHLESNQLEGSIPTQLGNLTELRILYLTGNRLTGSIPTQLGSLTNLTQAFLSSNQLNGNIPTELGNLAFLATLDLSNNQLSGSIPAQLGSLSELKILGLSNNRLTGSIPAQLGNLLAPTGKLTSLFICNNYLTGAVPTALRSSILKNYPTSQGYDPIACQVASGITFGAPFLTVLPLRNKSVDVSTYATDGSYIITCGDAIDVDSKITLRRLGCYFVIIAGATRGTATFRVPLTSSGGSAVKVQLSVNISEIDFQAPTDLKVTEGGTVTVDALSYASDGSFTISCSEATSVSSKFSSVTRTGCSYAIAVTAGSKGSASLTVPYSSSGGHSLNGVININISNIEFTAPTSLTMGAGETLAVSAGGYASDGSFTISCAEATGVSTEFSSVTRTANSCNYSVVAKATASAGSASFTVPYTSSGGDTQNGQISITITAISYTAPTDLKVVAGASADINASSWATHTGYTVSCDDAKSIHAKLSSVTRTANTCNYRITATATASAGDATFTIPYSSSSGATLDAQVTVKVSNIVYTAPTNLTMAAGETLAVSAGGYATDGTFTITCADATNISTEFTSVSRTANTCNYSAVAKATASAGSATFTVPYTSTGGDTQNGIISVTISAISYTAPTDLKVVAGSNTDVTASSWASHSGYTISCGDAKSIHAKLSSVTRTANTCNYRITAKAAATAGDATFTIPYTSTSGATLDAQVTVKVSNIAYTAPTTLSMAAGETLAVSAGGYATDGTFTITCADATSISTEFTSVSRTANTCNYSAVAKATASAGSASFTVPYTSSGGDTHNGVISITITAISLHRSHRFESSRRLKHRHHSF